MELMRTSQKGIALIKEHEGVRLNAYKDSVGIWTVGYGHTKGVTSTTKVTAAEAEKLLKEDIMGVERSLNGLGINFKQCQYDALVSWIFNLGAGNFNRSSMKKLILSKADDMVITDQMVKWHNAGGRPLLGLKKRRCAEANMWLEKEVYFVDASGNIKKK